MELNERGIKLSTSYSSEEEIIEQEEALSISSEEDDALKEQKKSDEARKELTIPKDEIDGDSSLYSVSDLEEDNNSDISFTDVPSLITMDEEPNQKANVSISQLVSQTSPKHSNGVS
jgi:hypothetical protein